MRNACAWVAAAGLLVGSASSASAQEAAAVRQEIDQLRRDFETLKQQDGDRLTALESKLAAVEGAAPAAAAQPPQPRRPRAAARDPAARNRRPPPRCLRARQARAARAARCRSTAQRSAAPKVFNPDMAVIGDFLGAAGHNSVAPAAGARAARVRGVVPGRRRSVRARRLLHLVRRGRRQRRGRLRHVHGAARRTADEGRQDARGVRQGEHAAQPRAAVGRPSARHAISSAAKTASTTPASRSRG